MLRMVARLLVAWAVAHCAYGYLEIIDVEPQIVSPSLLIPPPQILPPPPPPYRSSANISVTILKYIKEKIELPLTPAKQNLGTILLAISVVSQGLTKGLSYDAAYGTIGKIVLLGNLMPETVRDMLDSGYDDKLKKLDPVVNLINDICPDRVADYKCDWKIDRYIKRNPTYKGPAKLLLEMAKLCEHFIQHRIHILKAAAECRVLEYFSKNKYVLKPFIKQEAIVINVDKEL